MEKIKVLDALSKEVLCQLLSGVKMWEASFVNDIDLETISPRQRWFLYNAVIRFRRYIHNRDLLDECWCFIMDNPSPPQSRTEADKLLKMFEPRIGSTRKPKEDKNYIPGYMTIARFQKDHNMYAKGFENTVKQRVVDKIGSRYNINDMKAIAQEFITGKLLYR